MLIKGRGDESAPWRYVDKTFSMGERSKAWKLTAQDAEELLACLKKSWPGMRFEIEDENLPLFKES